MRNGKKTYGVVFMSMSALQLLLPVFLFLLVTGVKLYQYRQLHSERSNAHIEYIAVDRYGTAYQPGDEFLHRGKLYDIKTVSIHNGQYIMAMLPDDAETKLNELTTFVFGSFGGNELRQIKVLPFVFLYFESLHRWHQAKMIPPPQPLFAFISPYFPNHFCGIPKPPPRGYRMTSI